MQHKTPLVRYGRPKEITRPHIKEFYCAMCNRVPVHSWGKAPFAPKDIENLYPILVEELTPVTGEKKPVIVMVCAHCIRAMRKQFTDQMKLPLEKAKEILRRMREEGQKLMDDSTKDDDDETPGEDLGMTRT